MSTLIDVQGVGKAYPSFNSRWDQFLSLFAKPRKDRFAERWVLRNVSFSAGHGEGVGIIGMNGAGKSTLLKLVVGTTVPTEGTIRLQGRVAALLELGIGFHPDYTGRQNAVMAGQLLGYSNGEIADAMPSIEEFAEIGSAIDEPIRSYSSGMQMRLAFSVATAVRPDVLIVDEALSVGDSYFQAKSFDRIRTMKEAGTTLLFVSHDPAAVKTLCDRAILLDRGRVIADADPEVVLNHYNALLAARTVEYKLIHERDETGHIRTRSGSGEIRATATTLRNEAGLEARALKVGEAATLEVTFEAAIAVNDLVVGFAIRDRLGREVFGTNTHYLKEPIAVRPGAFVARFDFPVNIGTGNYSVSVAFHSGEMHIEQNYDWIDGALTFDVINFSKPTFVGTSFLPIRFRCEAAETTALSHDGAEQAHDRRVSSC